MRNTERKRQLIVSSCFTMKSYHEATRRLNSSYVDHVSKGVGIDSSAVGNPSAGAVLATWNSVPLGMVDVPTLNGMVYRRSLWQSLFDSPIINAMIENGAYWGESCHTDSDEVMLQNVALRITDWGFSKDGDFVVGNVDLMNTPNGAICYTLSKAGRIGTSTRGYGTLNPIGNGLTEVDQETYAHVCSDAVALPAVPSAQLTSSYVEDFSHAGIDQLTEDLRAMVVNAARICPDNPVVERIVASFVRSELGRPAEDEVDARIRSAVRSASVRSRSGLL